MILTPDNAAKVRAALELALERLQINDCEGEEAEAMETVSDALAALDAVAKLAATSEQIERARAEYATDECEIDDCASTSPNDEGTWVSAWVWLADPYEDEDEEDDSEEEGE